MTKSPFHPEIWKDRLLDEYKRHTTLEAAATLALRRQIVTELAPFALLADVEMVVDTYSQNGSMILLNKKGALFGTFTASLDLEEVKLLLTRVASKQLP